MTDRELLELLVEGQKELKGKVDNLQEEVTQLNTRVGRVEKDVKDIKLTIENEIRRDISIIAENPLSLNAKLDHALLVSEENRRDLFDLRLRVSMLEIQNPRRTYYR